MKPLEEEVLITQDKKGFRVCASLKKGKIFSKIEGVAGYCKKHHPDASYVFCGDRDERNLFVTYMATYNGDDDE